MRVCSSKFLLPWEDSWPNNNTAGSVFLLGRVSVILGSRNVRGCIYCDVVVPRRPVMHQVNTSDLRSWHTRGNLCACPNRWPLLGSCFYLFTWLFCAFQANGLQDLDSMWRLLMAEEEAACITCPVRPVNPFESFLALAQTFECET